MGGKPKVYATRSDIPASVLERLKKEFDLDTNAKQGPATHAEIVAAAKGKEGIFCVYPDRIDQAVVAAGIPTLKIVAAMSSGVEYIDIMECEKKGVLVTNAPDACVHSTAELTLGLMLLAGRRCLEAAREVKMGNWIYSWSPLWMCGDGLSNAVVGIVGMGRIGTSLASYLKTFKVKEIIFYDKYSKNDPSGTKRVGSLDDVVKNADFIAVLIPLTLETKHMFNKEVFHKMKKNAIFVNVSSGGCVQHDDLYEALKGGIIRGAAIDSTDPEPMGPDHKLLTLPNCIVTPHIGHAEERYREALGQAAVDNLVAVLNNKQPAKSPVNRV